MFFLASTDDPVAEKSKVTKTNNWSLELPGIVLGLRTHPGVRQAGYVFLYPGWYREISLCREPWCYVVPEIEMRSFWQLYMHLNWSCSGKPFTCTMCFWLPIHMCRRKTFRFLNVFWVQNVSFPNPIGGDECKKTPWGKCPDLRLRMQTESKSVKNCKVILSEERENSFVRGKTDWWRDSWGWTGTEAMLRWRGKMGIRRVRGRRRNDSQSLLSERGTRRSPAGNEAIYPLLSISLDRCLLSYQRTKQILGAGGYGTGNQNAHSEADVKFTPYVLFLRYMEHRKQNYQLFWRAVLSLQPSWSDASWLLCSCCRGIQKYSFSWFLNHCVV
jgi:hypothetical protein